MKKYRIIRDSLKKQIQLGEFKIGDLLPSENELCKTFSITRTTARKALDELLKEGFIEKQHGKGSIVIERRKSLGLLNVKGFSEAVGENVKTIFLQKPKESKWNGEIFSSLNSEDKQEICLFFERLRFVADFPVSYEKNWFSGAALPGFIDLEFTEGSFFKTLSQKYLIEVVGSSSELRAEAATNKVAKMLQIEPGAPILHISIKFKTSNPKLTIYSELFCNTQKFPIGSSYYL
ncbi:MAG: GntR family transcriptional regulator [Tangfeifania sp.]